VLKTLTAVVGAGGGTVAFDFGASGYVAGVFVSATGTAYPSWPRQRRPYSAR
jgi:hypothetical protein